MSVTTDPLAAAITDAVIGAGMRVGRNRLQTVVEQAILAQRNERCFAPHCDPSVLHPPGDCEHCDKYPDWQAYRETAYIAFTGSEQERGSMRETREGVYEPGLAPCPSTWFREPQVRDRWPGNRASTGAERPSITNIEIPAALEATAPRPPVSRPWLRRRKT